MEEKKLGSNNTKKPYNRKQRRPGEKPAKSDYSTANPRESNPKKPNSEETKHQKNNFKSTINKQGQNSKARYNRKAKPGKKVRANSQQRPNKHRRIKFNTPRNLRIKAANIDCSICKKNIAEPLTAIIVDEASPAHFDCVVARINGIYNTDKTKKIVYLGTGKFGVITRRGKKITIHSTINEELQDMTAEWRKNMQSPYLEKILDIYS